MGFNIEEFMNNSSMKFLGKDASKRGKTVMLPVSKLVPADGNFYSRDKERVRKLAASIEMLSTEGRPGIQQDLIVKPIEGTDTYEIIAGETRWSAVNLLLEEGRIYSDLVPCRVEASGDAVREELILILTNSTQRVRSDAEKLQEIGRLRELLTEYKKTHSLNGTVQQAIADILGVSKTKVGTLENIKRNLSNDLMEQYKNGEINTSVANKLAGLSGEEQESAYDYLVSNGKIRSSDVDLFIAAKTEKSQNNLDSECSLDDSSINSAVPSSVPEEVSVAFHVETGTNENLSEHISFKIDTAELESPEKEKVAQEDLTPLSEPVPLECMSESIEGLSQDGGEIPRTSVCSYLQQEYGKPLWKYFRDKLPGSLMPAFEKTLITATYELLEGYKKYLEKEIGKDGKD